MVHPYAKSKVNIYSYWLEYNVSNIPTSVPIPLAYESVEVSSMASRRESVSGAN